jgi:hypothetical protein
MPFGMTKAIEAIVTGYTTTAKRLLNEHRNA